MKYPGLSTATTTRATRVATRRQDCLGLSLAQPVALTLSHTLPQVLLLLLCVVSRKLTPA